MALSHFRVVQLPSDVVISKIDQDDIIINQLYPIADQSKLNFNKIPSLEGHFVSDSFSVQVYDDEIDQYGNEVAMPLLWKENENEPLFSSSVVASFQQNVSESILDYLDINPSVEFIEIINFQGPLNILEVGERYSPAELSKINLTTLESGGGLPYYFIEYKIGRSLEVDETIYSITINVDFEAALNFISENVEQVPGTNSQGLQDVFHRETITVEVVNGPANGQAELTISNTYNFLAGTDSDSTLFYNGEGEELIDNNPKTIFIELDKNGYLRFTVINSVLASEVGSYSGNITIDLVAAGGSPAYVSLTNNQVIQSFNS